MHRNNPFFVAASTHINSFFEKTKNERVSFFFVLRPRQTIDGGRTELRKLLRLFSPPFFSSSVRSVCSFVGGSSARAASPPPPPPPLPSRTEAEDEEGRADGRLPSLSDGGMLVGPRSLILPWGSGKGGKDSTMPQLFSTKK